VIPLSSDVNIFSIIELLTNSVDDNKSSDLATACGARIYTYVNYSLVLLTKQIDMI